MGLGQERLGACGRALARPSSAPPPLDHHPPTGCAHNAENDSTARPQTTVAARRQRGTR